MQRGEGIVGDLRLCSADCGEESGFSGIRQANKSRVGNQLQAQADGALLARLAGIGVARGAIGGRLEMRVAEAAIAALGNRHVLADLREIRDQRLAVFFIDLCADWHFQHHILAVGAGAVLAHAIAAALCLEVLLITVVDQGVEAGDRLHHDVAALAAIAAVRAAELDEFFTPERHAAVPARAGRNINLGFIEEFHGVRVYRIAQSFAKDRRE